MSSVLICFFFNKLDDVSSDTAKFFFCHSGAWKIRAKVFSTQKLILQTILFIQNT
jgi:hypothetical protein